MFPLILAVGLTPAAPPSVDHEEQAKAAIAIEIAKLSLRKSATPVAPVVPVAPPPKTVTVPPKPVVPTRTTATYRQPVGHTHTCANGHTWDHQANPGHTCKICGLQQFVQDPVARPVLVSPATTPPESAPTYQPPYQLYGSGGCANGSCPTVAVPARQGIFKRR